MQQTAMMEQEKKKYDMKLPRNGKEGLLYGTIISTITVIFMTTMNVLFSVPDGSSASFITGEIIKVIPIIWIIVMIIEPMFIGKIAEKLVTQFTLPTDSFNAKLLFRILFTVIGMSFCMTIIGDLIGNGFEAGLFNRFLENWPRNLLVVLVAEVVIIQPIARFVMVKLHQSQDRKMAKVVERSHSKQG